MTELFLTLVNRAIAAGWLVLAILVLRLVLKKAPKWTRVLMWGLVAVRLLCPFTLESIWSLIPSARTIEPKALLESVPTIHSGVSSINAMVNPVLEQHFAATPENSANPLQIWTAIAAAIWVMGMIVLLLYALISYLRLKKHMATAMPMGDALYRSEFVSFPFVLGIIHPKIYLPVTLEGEALDHVIAHERAHIRRRDHWWKPLGFLLLTVFWFQPLLWVAYVLLCRDIELACDERVIRDMDREQRANYSQALLQCSIRRRSIAACPLAFGEVGVKERVKNVLNYHKPAFWVIIVAVTVCVAVAVCFLTDPLTETVKYPWVQEYTGTVDTEEYETISADFAIGADRNGQAVFKDPEKAFDTFVRLYADTLEQLREAHDLPPITAQDYERYKTYGWQFTGGTPAEQERASFVSKFLDIYENSFISSMPSDVQSTRQTLSLEQVLALAEKGEALTWSDFAEYAYTETGSGLYIRVYEIDETFSLWIGGPSVEEPPMYIRLCVENDMDTALDIREGNVQSFIRANTPFQERRNLCTYTRENAWEPSVTFYADGTYLFTYALISSTLGHGTYFLSEDQLTLSDDTGVHYVFTVVDDTLVSHGMPWGEQSSFTDPSEQRDPFTDLPHDVVFVRTDGNAADWETVLSLARQQRAAELVAAICASPAQMSNPWAYLDAHPEEYAELVAGGADTLRYCFGRFLEGNQVGLDGHIMAEACREIMQSWGMARNDILYETGQSWFDQFQKNTLRLAEDYSDAELQEQYPVQSLLLTCMSNS